MKVYKTPCFSYIRMSDIPDEYYVEFAQWVSMQTRPVVEEHDDAVYSWDWKRWLEWKTGKSKLLVWD